jgi:GTP-binding protein
MSSYPHARFLTSADEPGQFWVDQGAEVAFAGRSNSGKSSAINTITQRRALARTSKAPGQTRLVNFFELEPGRRLVDLPGYGFAKVPREMQRHWQTLLERFFAVRESLAGLFLIVDIRRGIDARDLQMRDFAAGSGHAVHVLLTKSDKLGQGEALTQARHARAALGAAASVQLFSAVSHTGVDEARRRLRALLAAHDQTRRAAAAAPP